MVNPSVGTVMMFGFDFVPIGWLPCNGAMVKIHDWEELFKVIGTRFGGDGRTWFKLPDMRGRTTVGSGHGVGLTPRTAGQMMGVDNVILSGDELPPHSHACAVSEYHITARCAAGDGNTDSPVGNTIAKQERVEQFSNAVPDECMKDGTIEVGSDLSLTSAGRGMDHNNFQPSIGLNYCIAAEDTYKYYKDKYGKDKFLIGSIIAMGGELLTDESSGWHICENKLLNISEYTSLASLLHTTYGGDGRTNFGIPDLAGRAPVGKGDGPGIEQITLGRKLGTEITYLTDRELPAHTHHGTFQLEEAKLKCFSGKGNTDNPISNVFAGIPGVNRFSDAEPDQDMHDDSIEQRVGFVIESSGGGQAHENMQPSLVVLYYINTNGAYPIRS